MHFMQTELINSSVAIQKIKDPFSQTAKRDFQHISTPPNHIYHPNWWCQWDLKFVFACFCQGFGTQFDHILLVQVLPFFHPPPSSWTRPSSPSSGASGASGSRGMPWAGKGHQIDGLQWVKSNMMLNWQQLSLVNYWHPNCWTNFGSPRFFCPPPVGSKKPFVSPHLDQQCSTWGEPRFMIEASTKLAMSSSGERYGDFVAYVGLMVTPKSKNLLTKLIRNHDDKLMLDGFLIINPTGSTPRKHGVPFFAVSVILEVIHPTRTGGKSSYNSIRVIRINKYASNKHF